MTNLGKRPGGVGGKERRERRWQKERGEREGGRKRRDRDGKGKESTHTQLLYITTMLTLTLYYYPKSLSTVSALHNRAQ